MANKIGSVYAEIGADTSKMDNALKGTKGKLSDFKTGLNNTVKELTGFNLAQIGVATVVGVVGKALVDTVKGAVAYAEQVRDLGRISGASSEETSRLIQVSDDLKVSYETLTQAARGAAKNGIALTTEELAKASDEYLKIPDAAGRAAYAIDKFGRAGLEMTKVLEAGGQALREMAAEQSGGLILTEKQVQAARKLEIAQDDLEDSFKAIAIAVGNLVVPAIADFLKWVKDTIWAEEKLKAATLKNSETFEEYRATMEKGALAQNGYINANGDLMRSMYLNGRVTEVLIQKNFALDRVQWDVTKGLYKMEDERDRMTNAEQRAIPIIAAMSKEYANYLSTAMAITKSLGDFKKSMGELEGAAGELKTEIEKLSKLKVLSPEENARANELWKSWLLLTAEIEKGGEGAGKAKDELKKVNAELWTLTNGTYLTADQKKQLDDAKTKLGENATKMGELKHSFEEATKAFIYNLLLQKAAADGAIDDIEFDNLTTIAEAFGLITKEAGDMAREINKIDLSKGKVELSTVLGIVEKFKNAAGVYDFTINTYHHDFYDNGIAPGRPSIPEPIPGSLAGTTGSPTVAPSGRPAGDANDTSGSGGMYLSQILGELQNMRTYLPLAIKDAVLQVVG